MNIQRSAPEAETTLADTVPIDLAELRQLLDEGGAAAL
ncbi:hypothetical protein AS850_13165 [Frondihabitans sp. 762G35]|nr:hypothetical protein AS850_13165 [Frondihabitans sp. 762G35]